MEKQEYINFLIKKLGNCNNVKIVDAYLPVFRLGVKNFEGVKAFTKAKEYKCNDYSYIVFIYNNTLYIFKAKDANYNRSNIVFKTPIKDAYKYVDIHLFLPEWAA